MIVLTVTCIMVPGFATSGLKPKVLPTSILTCSRVLEAFRCSSSSVWNHTAFSPAYHQVRVCSGYSKVHSLPYQRPSTYLVHKIPPQYFAVWVSWESWLLGHVRQPPILSGRCRPAKFTLSTHPGNLLPRRTASPCTLLVAYLYNLPCLRAL
ncbi:hypothetical protein BDP55DRAFT_274387 [Colletotrichum godetiae]|uniref:Uncharacterized protein n=1 Tax=Colletotrichum godetiae TaxID=1209918 RepID=A0AAJ0EUH2_9PEZI|nr:uncharacterized protein BDP55DRAFT_274387 [Colletotrichum godetiae]KAK1672219.1 hypothetical protein BDP55DRAFT_274387 [Colletotrichum godetiae]